MASRECEKNGKMTEKRKALETTDRERSKKKVRGKKDDGNGIHRFTFLNMNVSNIQENNNNKMQCDLSLVTGLRIVFLRYMN